MHSLPLGGTMTSRHHTMKFFSRLFRSRSNSRHRPRVVLYTRQDCHLCDIAKETLMQYGQLPEEVDIDGDPALRARFDCCVPVVEIDGKIRFRGHVDKRLLRRLL